MEVRNVNDPKRLAQIRWLFHGPLIGVAVMLAVCLAAIFIKLHRPLMILPLIPVTVIWLWAIGDLFISGRRRSP